MTILGLHHVTATVDEAQADLDFYAGLLGLRLVKKTVNFDNHHVFHFYYGDRRGTPGTIWTTFPYHGRGVRAGTRGAGQVTVTSFSVPPGALDFWRARFAAHNLLAGDGSPRFDERSIGVSDPSGLVIEMVESAGDARTPWITAEVGDDVAIRGLHSVTMTVHDAAPSIEFMTRVLGYRVTRSAGGRARLAVNSAAGDEPGRTIDVLEHPDTPRGVNGLGTVHHVAMAIADEPQQLQVRERLLRLGVQVTPVMDRQYFKSIYFREPGGVLFEVATLQPGFAVDEPLEALGRSLKLPPWEESSRAEIERGLPHVVAPA
jgi:glyoxalase family protein